MIRAARAAAPNAIRLDPRRRMAPQILTALATAFALVGVAVTPTAWAGGECTGDLDPPVDEIRKGPRVRFGITPAGFAGAFGPQVPAVPDRPKLTLRALDDLRPGDVPFVLRLNRFFWSDGREGFERFLRATRHYTKHGYLVELQLRYHPRPDQEGDIRAWKRFVRKVVRRFGKNPGLVGIQVTNEVNLTFSPDSSDGAYERARDALIGGVIAAKNETRKRGHGQVTIGFNWFYRTDPGNEQSFWTYLRDHGGKRFRRAVDWVGLDAYPGTIFPPAGGPGGERDGIVNGMSQLRECFMPVAGLGPKVPIHVEENGWPTDLALRTYGRQKEALRLMVRAVHDFRAVYNVTDYRWFDLRDHRTSSPNFQHHYGLMEDDYVRKPAFFEYRRLLAKLARGR
jgi:hypothetical protein